MKTIRRIISAILCVILTASLLLTFGCAGIETDETTTAPAETSAQVTESAEKPTAELMTENVSETETQTETQAAVPETVEEIVALFNASANRIKTEATKVTKNWEKRIVDEENLVLPKALEGTAKSLISTFLKDDTDPIIYDTREEIVSEYIVPDKDYVSKLTPDTVLSATCEDKGEQYVITIKLKPEKNPVSGKGVGAVCDVIEAYEVTEKNIVFLEDFSTDYRDCVVIATVDKATGRVVHSNYSAPLILAVKVNLFGTHNINVGLNFVKDYTIEY